MACPDETALMDLVEGRLAGEPLDQIDQHLNGCDDCRRLVGALMRGDDESSGHSSSSPEKEDHLLLEGLGLHPRLEPGVVVGRYVIEQWLAAGGMGDVYRARDPELHRKVAVKLVRPDRGADFVDDRRRLLREAQALAQIAHPNVVTVHDAGYFGEQVFIAMELVEEGTLLTWLERGPRSQAEIMDLFTQAGRGLAAAHAAGLIHRDFKPSNVLVGRDGRARVTDFGLVHANLPGILSLGGPAPMIVAKLRTPPAAVPPAVRAGTPAYMAPEQSAGEPVDARADQFSFCVALYEALHGKRPAGRPAASTSASATRPDLGSPLPDHVSRALEQGLSTSPDARFASMDGLLAALAPAEASSRRAVEPAPRLPLIWILLAVLLVLGLLAAVAWMARGGVRPAARSGHDVMGCNRATASYVVSAGGPEPLDPTASASP